MHARVKLLLMTLIVFLFVVPLAFAQDTTPSAVESFNQTATALAQSGAAEGSAESEAVTAEPTTDLISQFAATATALAQPRTETTPAEAATAEASPESAAEPTEEAVVAETLEASPEATVEAAATDTGAVTPAAENDDNQARGLPLGILLIGAVAVLLIGTIVIIQQNPRPLDDEE